MVHGCVPQVLATGHRLIQFSSIGLLKLVSSLRDRVPRLECIVQRAYILLLVRTIIRPSVEGQHAYTDQDHSRTSEFNANGGQSRVNLILRGGEESDS